MVCVSNLFFQVTQHFWSFLKAQKLRRLNCSSNHTAISYENSHTPTHMYTHKHTYKVLIWILSTALIILRRKGIIQTSGSNFNFFSRYGEFCLFQLINKYNKAFSIHYYYNLYKPFFGISVTLNEGWFGILSNYLCSIFQTIIW